MYTATRSRRVSSSRPRPFKSLLGLAAVLLTLGAPGTSAQGPTGLPIYESGAEGEIWQFMGSLGK